MARIPGKYGIDAPYVPVLSVVGGVALLAYGLIGLDGTVGAVVMAIGILLLIQAGAYMNATLRGKFEVWVQLIRGVGLRGDESLLDVGCGRGLVLITAAEQLPQGHAVGLDLWRGRDQSGNSGQATMANAEAAGVADRIELRTGDMAKMPFADESFDVVVSSVAVQNIKDPDQRARAIREIYRVTKPSGRILIADIRSSRQYVAVLKQVGAVNIERRSLGWRMMYGNPFFTTYLVNATKI